MVPGTMAQLKVQNPNSWLKVSPMVKSEYAVPCNSYSSTINPQQLLTQHPTNGNILIS
jgi:hypothetical protein